MAYDGMHPLCPYTQEDKLQIRGELELKESTIEEGVEAITEWFNKQPHLVDAGIDHDFIERMLIVAKGSLEKTKRRIDNFYKYRSMAPELVQNRDKILSDSQDLWRSYLQVCMPRLYNGNRITVIKLIDPDPSAISCEQIFMNTFMLGDIRMKYDYFLGDIWIVDLKHASFSHILRLNPVCIQKAAHIFQDGLGMRIKTIHVLNPSSVCHHIITFMRQFFNPKIMERIVIHDSLEDLHKHLPKKYLPKDLGGEEPSTMEFKDKLEKEMRSTKTKQFLINASKMTSDEKKRSNIDINEEYLAGSFRKIEFD